MYELRSEKREKVIDDKRLLYLHRGFENVRFDKKEEWETLIKDIYSQQLDRDLCLDISLNMMELLNIGVEPEIVAEIFANDVEYAVSFQRMMPIEGCMTRDVITNFNRQGIDIGALVPEESFLRLRKTRTK